MESIKNETLNTTYNKYHIVQGTDKRNFIWYKTRKSDYLYI